MKLKPAQRRQIKNSINHALRNHHELIAGSRFETAATGQAARELVRVSCMIANLNGRPWLPEAMPA